MSFDIKLSTF